MKKFFIFGTVAVVLFFAVALGVKSYRTTHNTLFYKNLDALANPEGDNEGGGSDPGSGGGYTPENDGISTSYKIKVCICSNYEPLDGYYDWADMKKHCHEGLGDGCGDAFYCRSPKKWYCKFKP